MEASTAPSKKLEVKQDIRFRLRGMRQVGHPQLRVRNMREARDKLGMAHLSVNVFREALNSLCYSDGEVRIMRPAMMGKSDIGRPYFISLVTS